MTLDELIVAAMKASVDSPLGGDTVVCLCEYEREYIEINHTILDTDSDGAVFLVCLPNTIEGEYERF